MNNNELNRNLIERVAMGDILRRRARDSAEYEAVVDFSSGKRRSYTYSQLNKRVNQLVRGLRQRCVKQQQKLALISTNHFDFITGLFACYKMGVIAVPINFLQNPDAIRYVLEHSDSVAVVYDPLFEDLVFACTQGNPKIANTFTLGEQRGKADASLQELMNGQDDSEIEDCLIGDRDTAHLIYTSGTTSQPKGVETSHLSLYFSAMSNAISLQIPLHQNNLIVLPMFHCAALSIVFATLNVGGKLVVQAAFEAATIIDLMQTEQIQSAGFLPMMWKALLQVDGIESMSFPDFTDGIYAMSAMDKGSIDKIRSVFECKMHLGSGQTEFIPLACVFYDNSAQQHQNGNYWGVPGIGVDQAILDESGKEAAQGQLGEICWRGPQSMTGYFKNATDTEEASRFAWHHSGDLGFIDDCGQLVFVDRKKDMIKSGGENVSSIKVEQVIMGITGVALAAVFAVPHKHWSEAVCVCIQLLAGASLDEATVLAHCKDKLGAFEIPKKIIFVNRFDLTGTGKIRKVSLREKYADIFKND